MKTDLKRQNFNVTPEQEAEIQWLREELDAPSTKHAILTAVRIVSVLARETKHGRDIYIQDASGSKERLLIPQLSRSGMGEGE